MPASVVKTPEDEKNWEDAKRAFKTTYDREPSGDKDWVIVMSIFKKMSKTEDWGMDSGSMFTTDKLIDKNKKMEGYKEKLNRMVEADSRKNASQISVGQYYMAGEVGSPNKPLDKVKIIFKSRDGKDMWNVRVQFDNGKKDDWYLGIEDDIFRPLRAGESYSEADIKLSDYERSKVSKLSKEEKDNYMYDRAKGFSHKDAMKRLGYSESVMREGREVNQADNDLFSAVLKLRKAIEKEKPEAKPEYLKIKQRLDDDLTKLYKKYNL